MHENYNNKEMSKVHRVKKKLGKSWPTLNSTTYRHNNQRQEGNSHPINGFSLPNLMPKPKKLWSHHHFMLVGCA